MKTSPGVWRIVWIVAITTAIVMVGLCIYFAYFDELHIPPFL